MLFNSIEFLIFLPLVFIGYWFIFNKALRTQNFLLLAASYVFYGWWDWRFLGLIFISSVIDFICGLEIERNPLKKKFYLSLSVAFNLGILGFFKYFNFFIDSTVEFLDFLGFTAHYTTLQIILPVGISFYTFQTLSYSIDIYRGKMNATKDPIAFFTFVAFFPQLVAGPIERASNLLPQFYKSRNFVYENGSKGMKLILWGLFKKMVIADNCALVVNPIFENYTEASGLELIIGAVLFSFQIYGDFSGYSDIAIGVALLFGFDLMTNFRTPYFSRDIGEFWRRWHISLSTWFRDYVYIPLGGSKVSKLKSVRNIFIVFLVSGFWHGANWTFIAWGGFHALLFIPLFIFNRNRINTDPDYKLIPSIKVIFQILLTFSLVSLAWVFFRAPSITDASNYILSIFNSKFLPQNYAFIGYELRIALLLFISLEWIGKNRYNWFALVENKTYRKVAYTLVAFLILYWGVFFEAQEFIYFQF